MRIPAVDRTRRSSGQAMVEAALVGLVFTAIVIGIFDLAQVLFVHQTFVERARAAVRYGVVHDGSQTAVQNMVLYGQPSAPGGASSGVFGLTAGMVQVTTADEGTTEQRMVVVISDYPYRLFSPWIGRSFTGRPIIASMSLESP